MPAEARPTIATMIDRAGSPRSAFPQFRLLAPPKRSRLDDIFAEEIVLCMVEARRPGRHHVERVAARIWNDVQPGGAKIGWRDIVPGSPRHRRMIAAARAALGDPADAQMRPRPPALD